MNFFKKKFLVSLLLLSGFYFLTRIIYLTSFPIFCDEAIYIRWAQVMRAEAALRFLPLSDGKQPLFMWLMIPFLKIFSDPLLAGRLLSVATGWFSLAGIFFLTFLVFDSFRAAFLAGLTYVLAPYVLFFDRMALVDSLLASLGIWTLTLGVLLVRHKRIDLAMICGIVLGAAFLTKSPALFFAILLPLTIIVIPFPESKKKNLIKSLAKIFVLWLIVYIFAFTIQSILHLGPNFHMIAIRNKDYVFSLNEVLKHPTDPLFFHLKDVLLWFLNLFTLPLFLLGISGIYLGFQREKRGALLLLFWMLFPLFSQCLIAKVFTSRYLLFTIFPLIIFSGLSLAKITEFIKSKTVKIVLLVFFFGFAIRYDYLLLFSPYRAPLTSEMKYGYLLAWTSGEGIPHIREFLKKEAEKGKIVVGTEGYFGTLPDGLLIYFDKNPNVTILGVGIDLKEIPSSLKESSLTTPTYLVINQSRLKIESDPRLELILKIPKGEITSQTDFLSLYKIKPL